MDRRLHELESLYRERHAHFVRVARAITGDPERAHEAVQDAFADAIRSRRTFRGDAPLEAWVWRAVLNAARKALRRPLVEAGTKLPPEAALAAPPQSRSWRPRSPRCRSGSVSSSSSATTRISTTAQSPTRSKSKSGPSARPSQRRTAR